MMGYFLASVLALSPVLAEDTHLRVVSVGTDDHEVLWYLDGEEVARTSDGEAASFSAPAGRRELHAVTEHRGEWQVLARPDPRNGTGVAHVPAWTARHDPGDPSAAAAAGERGVPRWAFPVAVAVGGAAFALWPERGRTKGP